MEHKKLVVIPAEMTYTKKKKRLQLTQRLLSEQKPTLKKLEGIR